MPAGPHREGGILTPPDPSLKAIRHSLSAAPTQSRGNCAHRRTAGAVQQTFRFAVGKVGESFPPEDSHRGCWFDVGQEFRLTGRAVA